MFRIIVILLGTATFLTGCGSAADSNGANANSNTAPVNTAVKLDPANMPPGLSASPLPMTGKEIPGIPANGTVLPKGTTPTPGIPSAEQLKKGLKPGLTPTPGIPDDATIRKAMGMPPLNINAQPPGNNVPMMKSNKMTRGRP